MAIRRIFKDNPKMCHITFNFMACTWSLFFVCVNFWLKTKWLSFYTLPYVQDLSTSDFFLFPKIQAGPWDLMINGNSWQQLVSFKCHITLKGTTMITSKWHSDKNIRAISPRKLFHLTMYESCCVESQPQTTYNTHLQTWNHMKLFPVKQQRNGGHWNCHKCEITPGFNSGTKATNL
jgi:hypothetical protein